MKKKLTLVSKIKCSSCGNNTTITQDRNRCNKCGNELRNDRNSNKNLKNKQGNSLFQQFKEVTDHWKENKITPYIILVIIVAALLLYFLSNIMRFASNAVR